MSRKFRILVVDDHPIVRQGLRQLLVGDSELEVCGEAEDVAEALRQVQVTLPDLVVLDISLKASYGLDLIDQIRHMNPPVRVLVWSMLDESLFAERALRSGAAGYISKRAPIEQVISAIRQVLHGRTYLPPQITEQLVHRAVGRSDAKQDGLAALSDRELQIFEFLGRGVKPQTIAQRLQLSVKTVNSYREKIKFKLGAGSSSQLTQQAVAWFLAKSRLNQGNVP